MTAAPPAAASRPLSTAVVGVRYAVVAVAGDDDLARRLTAHGLWPGAVVERLRHAPFGDPVLFRLHGFRLALRRTEAERVTVVEVVS
ncbi:MAG: ferrous iron transport protein A [Planctomycetes bacterium]|nr:ferrous iron transport protein A [Planctomycetota bacterium]